MRLGYYQFCPFFVNYTKIVKFKALPHKARRAVLVRPDCIKTAFSPAEGGEKAERAAL